MGKILLNDVEYGIVVSNISNVDDTKLVKKDSIVTTLDDTVTDEQIPSAKAVYDKLSDLPTDSGSKCYTSLDELGLTADATVEDVVNALKNGESFLAPVNTFTNYETIFPNKLPNDQWNKIHIIKGTSLANSHIRCFSQSGTCEYLANTNNTNIVSWNDVSGTYIDISDSTIEKLGNEILKYPVGKYRINSITTGNKFTDLPSDAETKCGLIEVNGTAVGKSPFTDAWVYRMYKFECLVGTLSYVRRLNSGNTAGQIEADTGWQKEGRDVYTSLSELGLTAPVTVGEIFNIMPNKTIVVLACEDIVDHITDVPMSYGILTIKKNELGRFSIDYQNSLQGSACNVKRWIGTLKGLDGTGLTWKLVSTQTTYVALSDMGLTASATIQDVIDKLQIGDTALLRTDEFTNWSTLFNGIQWGYLKVEKTVNGLSNIELQEVVTPNRRYFGSQSSGKFSTWKQIASEITDVITNTSTIAQVPNANLVANEIHGKYFDIADYSDAMAMPIGKWRVDSNNKASQMQNLPVSKAGILEVKYLQGNDGQTAYTSTYKYAMLTYTAISGEKYERSFNSDNTVGNIVNDTGWKQIATKSIYNSVAELNKAKGTTIELVNGVDNTQKIVDALSIGEQFVSFYHNNANQNRFGINTSHGNLINEIRITKCLDADLTSKYAIVTAFMNTGIVMSRIYYKDYSTDWCMQAIGNGGSSTIYSTSEQAIGIWVDGKTIYRKTITKSSHAVNEQLITGVDTFIRGYGTCERAGYVYNVPHCGLLAGHLQDEDVTYLNFKLDKSSGALSTIGSSSYTISNLKVTIEYTKK